MTPEKRDELQLVIANMSKLSSNFYYNAIHIGNHSFIEFTGLMNEYIKICQQSLEQGIDFTLVNTHTKGQALAVKEYNTRYLKEKLNCIFDNCYDIELKDNEPKYKGPRTEAQTQSNRQA